MTKKEMFRCSECEQIFEGGKSEAREHWLSHMEDNMTFKKVTV